MSLIYMVQAFKLKVGCASKKLILLKLADNANDDGYCWPSYSYIAEMCEMSDRTVKRHIKQLVEMGYVEKKNRFNSTGKASNMYILNLDNKVSDKMTPTLVTEDHHLVTQCHQPSDTVSHESINEPINEPIYIDNFEFLKNEHAKIFTGDVKTALYEFKNYPCYKRKSKPIEYWDRHWLAWLQKNNHVSLKPPQPKFTHAGKYEVNEKPYEKYKT